ncbi:MAG TPA: serine hydrolase domain-containing protein [Candidatus Binatia bacterium]|nr:serine hydrolase domain-containing protein [Candidatus Binatia bacterium]
MLDRLNPRCRVPNDIASVTTLRPHAEVDPRSVGADPSALARAWWAIERLYASGAHPAIAVCLRRRGRVLLDRALGHARGNSPDDPPDAPKVAATPDTPFSILSASKPVAAMVAHLLDERDLLRLDDPICEYIPEFARHDKHTISLRHVLTHRAGVPNPPPDTMDPDLLERPEEIVELLCEQTPLWRPGTRLAYHAVTTGFLIAELVRVVTGKDIQTVLREEIREPLGLRWMRFGVEPEDVDRVAVNAFTGPLLVPPITTFFRRALGLDFYRAVELTNDTRFLTSVFPSANVVTTADELCRFYEMLRRGGELDGKRVFDRRTIVRATAEQSYLEPDMMLFLPFRYGMGFMLGAEWFSLYGPYTPHAFGHIGFTNVIGWADPERELSGAILTSGKPVAYEGIYYLFEALRQIGIACPRSLPGAIAGGTVCGAGPEP